MMKMEIKKENKEEKSKNRRKTFKILPQMSKKFERGKRCSVAFDSVNGQLKQARRLTNTCGSWQVTL
jgi:hypothetical protein